MEIKLCGVMLVLAAVAMAACIDAILDRPARSEIARGWPHAMPILTPALPQLAQTPADAGSGPSL